MLADTEKQKLLKQYRTHETDTASPQVQVALLTADITRLTAHFKTHVKDHHSRRGLLRMVASRRSLLDFLHRKDAAAYTKLITDLNIRK